MLRGSTPTITRIVISALSLLLGGGLCVLLNLVVSPNPLREDMPGASYRVGVYEFSDHASGFYNPETSPDGTTFVWTNPHATLNFKFGANMGRFAYITLRLAGNRPSSPTLMQAP